jgi:serine/threonine protein kinase
MTSAPPSTGTTMSSPAESAKRFLSLAAEGMAPIIPGCANVLAAGSKAGDRPAGQLQLKGIDYFGPRILERWVAAVQATEAGDPTESLVLLARLPADQTHAAASAAVDTVAPGAAPADKLVAVEYLTAIPLSLRRSLMIDPATRQPTLLRSGSDNDTLLRVLPADVPPFPVGTELPGTSYQLQELLGIGGFGAVYKARNRFEQNQPPRAIKFCLDSRMVATLHRERAILDRLMAVGEKHSSNRIVRLYGYALEGQPPFLVYEYVPGGDLTSHLTLVRQKTGRGFHPSVALELVRQVAEGLALAHSHGLVHRDLKPANILVSGSTIKLTDFGIGGVAATYATRGAGSLSVSMSALTSAADQASLFRGSGTPLYMSAEQRRGENPDPRHDLYSLGVVWYQLLVGDVTRELHHGWPDELVEEFQTPTEHIELIKRCVGYFKKRPVNAGELLSLLPAAAPRKAAAAKRPPANLAAGEYERLKALLAEQIDRDSFRQARQTVAAMIRLRPNDAEAIEVATFIEQRLATTSPREVLRLEGHEGWVRCVALAADGRRALSGGDDGTIRVWDLAGRREVLRLAGHSGAVMGLAPAPDGRRLISGGWDGTVRIWDLSTGRELRVIRGDWRTVKPVACSPDGTAVLAATGDNLVRVWEAEGGTEVGRFAGHAGLVHCVAVAPDGRLALSGGDDHSVRLWELKTGTEMKFLSGHTDAVTSVAFAPDGSWAASGSSDHSVRLWDLAAGRELRQLTGHGNWVNSVAISAGGRRILTGSGGEVRDAQFRDGSDTTVRMWDAQSGQELVRFEGHIASVTSVALTWDARYALSGSLDGTVRLWSVEK